jgi:hypothetical protein
MDDGWLGSACYRPPSFVYRPRQQKKAGFLAETGLPGGEQVS